MSNVVCIVGGHQLYVGPFKSRRGHQFMWDTAGFVLEME